MDELAQLEQGSEAWLRARCGSLGASRLHEALARTKTGWGASRANLLATMVVERLTGRPAESFKSSAMVTGTEREPDARVAYQFITGNTVSQIGLVRHPAIEWTHASPDGLVGPDGLLEIKAPQPAQHLSTLMGEPVADKYVLQMQWQMRCTGRDWCDFVSFNPDFPDTMQLFVQRFERDDTRLDKTEEEVSLVLGDVSNAVRDLQKRYP